MNNAARKAPRYTVSHCSMGWALVAEHDDGTGEGTLLGYFPTKADAISTRNDLLTLHGGR